MVIEYNIILYFTMAFIIMYIDVAVGITHKQSFMKQLFVF